MKRSKSKRKIILTIGDPQGIGPEIILKIFNDSEFISDHNLTILGTKKIFDHYSSLLRLKKISPKKIIELRLPSGFKINPGSTDRLAGKISGDAVKKATELCLSKKYDAMVTLPVSKESLNMGGYNYPGHTEMLTELSASESTVMILHSKKFSVALASGHCPVSEIAGKITRENLMSTIIAVNNSMVLDFKIKNPKISLLALNPHAGDNGLLGLEEIEVIMPVIEELNSLGFNIRGPYAADAFFANKTYEKSDITIAMYHDQGLIPFKMISFGSGVNFTAGLKIIRTSPDHGTAFDIAGLGKANTASTKEAIVLAESLVEN